MKITAGKGIKVTRVGDNTNIALTDPVQPIDPRTETCLDDSVVTFAVVPVESSVEPSLNAITETWEDSGLQAYSTINDNAGGSDVDYHPTTTDGSLMISLINSDGERLDWPLWGTTEQLVDLRVPIDSSSSYDPSDTTWTVQDGAGVIVRIVDSVRKNPDGSYTHFYRDFIFNSTGRLVEISARSSYDVEI